MLHNALVCITWKVSWRYLKPTAQILWPTVVPHRLECQLSTAPVNLFWFVTQITLTKKLTLLVLVKFMEEPFNNLQLERMGNEG